MPCPRPSSKGMFLGFMLKRSLHAKHESRRVVWVRLGDRVQGTKVVNVEEKRHGKSRGTIRSAPRPYNQRRSQPGQSRC